MSSEKENFSQKEDRDNKKDKGAVKAIIEMIELIIKYIKEQARLLIYENVISPIEKIRKRIILSIISAFIIGVASIFIGIGFILLLFSFMPAWVSFLVIGVILLIIGISILSKKK